MRPFVCLCVRIVDVCVHVQVCECCARACVSLCVRDDVCVCVSVLQRVRQFCVKASRVSMFRCV